VLAAAKLALGVASSRAASAGLNLLFSMALLRLLSKNEYGAYYVLYTVMTFATLLPGLAINSGFVYRYQHSDGRDALLSTFVALKAALVGVVGAIVVASWILGLIGFYTAIAVLAGLLLSFFDSAMCLAQARKDFRMFSALMPVRNSILLLTLFIAWLLSPIFNLAAVICSLLASGAILASVAIILSSGANIGMPSRLSLWELLGEARRFIAFEGSAIVLQRVEIWVLGFFATRAILSAADVAEYGAGFTFGFLFPIISSSITSILITKVEPGSRLSAEQMSRLIWLAACALCVAMVYAAFSYVAAKAFLGEKYTQLYWIIPLTCFGMYLSFCTNYARVALLAHREDRFINLIYVAQMVVGLVASICLIPTLGLAGAVAAFLTTRLFAFVPVCWQFYRKNKSHVV
jgi:O-antigen/teichoic acid export membrane protein